MLVGANDFSRGRGEPQEVGIDQPIINHHLSLAQQLHPPERKQADITWAGADQTNYAGAGARYFAGNGRRPGSSRFQ